jgi:RNA polymerase sigma-70 factor, ECF subfamily
VVELLHPDVVLIGDSDGKANTARRIMVDPEKIGRFFLGLLERYGPDSLFAGELVLVNGDIGVRLPDLPGDDEHRALSQRVTTFAVKDGRVAAIYDIVNPDKLTRLP